MEDYIGKICPYCKTEIKEGDAVKVCSLCGIPHHEACWIENKGCTTLGCAEQHTKPNDVCVKCGAPLGDGQDFCTKCGTPKGVAKKHICSKCGAELQEGQDFCHKCGTPKGVAKKRICNKCGTELQEDQDFCPKCGQKVDLQNNVGVNSVISQFNSGDTKDNSKKKKTPLIIGIVAGVAILTVILIVVLIVGGKKDFNKMYGDLASNSWCTIAADGSYMKLDTNPRDIDDDDLTWSDYESFVIPANDAIERINKELGFSDALMEKMNQTTALQGKQTDSNDKYIVSWTYHPDYGLEVMYEFKK